jgi:hypothetical protein
MPARSVPCTVRAAVLYVKFRRLYVRCRAALDHNVRTQLELPNSLYGALCPNITLPYQMLGGILVDVAA